MFWGLSLWGRFTLTKHLFLCICDRYQPKKILRDIKGRSPMPHWGSQCLPSIAGAGKSGTRFPNMAAKGPSIRKKRHTVKLMDYCGWTIPTAQSSSLPSKHNVSELNLPTKVHKYNFRHFCDKICVSSTSRLECGNLIRTSYRQVCLAEISASFKPGWYNWYIF